MAGWDKSEARSSSLHGWTLQRVAAARCAATLFVLGIPLLQVVYLPPPEGSGKVAVFVSRNHACLVSPGA